MSLDRRDAEAFKHFSTDNARYQARGIFKKSLEYPMPNVAPNSSSDNYSPPSGPDMNPI
jgi:hypothetical protein